MDERLPAMGPTGGYRIDYRIYLRLLDMGFENNGTECLYAQKESMLSSRAEQNSKNARNDQI